MKFYQSQKETYLMASQPNFVHIGSGVGFYTAIGHTILIPSRRNKIQVDTNY